MDRNNYREISLLSSSYKILPKILLSRKTPFSNEIIGEYVGLGGIDQPSRGANGEWRRLHNEELHSLYRSPYIVRVMKSRRLRWVGHVARMKENRSRWEDNIRMDLEEIYINAGKWVDSAQDRDYWRVLVNAALNLRVP